MKYNEQLFYPLKPFSRVGFFSFWENLIDMDPFRPDDLLFMWKKEPDDEFSILSFKGSAIERLLKCKPPKITRMLVHSTQNDIFVSEKHPEWFLR